MVCDVNFYCVTVKTLYYWSLPLASLLPRVLVFCVLLMLFETYLSTISCLMSAFYNFRNVSLKQTKYRINIASG